ncbi:hypothetical protein FHX49_000665 [Microbacterium endophyticum]|uniref:Uncharacterized protein n=1 Tax=Microbacterium endophyticum TaxID=1526412 RepID=A0A7W4V230_9MICO|nr:hypothetical protein [Microbacterium endophyticum]NIK37336.1 hypothetical protein [Microbacterium endophyticum]
MIGNVGERAGRAISSRRSALPSALGAVLRLFGLPHSSSRASRSESLDGRSPKLVRMARAAAPGGHQELLTSEARSKVYGATPSSDAKENTTLKNKYRRGVRMNDRRSPSGEPPEAPWSVASRTEQTTEEIGRGES